MVARARSLRWWPFTKFGLRLARDFGILSRRKLSRFQSEELVHSTTLITRIEAKMKFAATFVHQLKCKRLYRIAKMTGSWGLWQLMAGKLSGSTGIRLRLLLMLHNLKLQSWSFIKCFSRLFTMRSKCRFALIWKSASWPLIRWVSISGEMRHSKAAWRLTQLYIL